MTPEKLKEFIEKETGIKVDFEYIPDPDCMTDNDMYSYSFHTKEGRRYGISVRRNDFKFTDGILFFSHVVVKDWKILNKYKSGKKVKEVLQS